MQASASTNNLPYLRRIYKLKGANLVKNYLAYHIKSTVHKKERIHYQRGEVQNKMEKMVENLSHISILPK